jgi:hypothetical protein
VLLVGGGPRGRITYGEMLDRVLGAAGLSPLPREAFGSSPYYSDWVDTEESERLLRYQRRGFQDFLDDVAAEVGWRRPLVHAVAPLIRWLVVRRSRYYRLARAGGKRVTAGVPG